MAQRLILSGHEDGNARVHRIGYDQPDGTVVQVLPGANPPIIVVKVPGHSYWAGRGARGYAGVSYIVYTVTAVDADVLTVERVVDFEARNLEPWDRVKAIRWAGVGVESPA